MMLYNSVRLLTAVACLALVSCSDDADSRPDVSPPVNEPQALDSVVNPLDGDWTGSWGGGAQGDVIFQPVIAELVIEGDRVELSGFPDTEGLKGTLHQDAERIVVTADASDDDETAPQVLEYRYAVSGDDLTLTAADGREISFLKRRDAQVVPDSEGVPLP